LISSKLKPFFWFNVIAGVLIVILYQLLEYRQWGESTSSQVFDSLMKKETALALSEVPRTPLFFIDISRDDYERWGRPLLTPRSELIRMMDWAWQNGAKVIVLDILLDKPDCCDPAGDRELAAYLNNLAPNAQDTKIIVPIAINEDGVIVKPLFPESSTPKGAGIIHYATPLLESNQIDYRERYWHPYEMAKDDQGNTVVVWSVSFMAAVLYQGRQADLEKYTDRILAEEFDSTPSSFPLDGSRVNLAPYTRFFFEDINPQRIRFRFMPGELAGQDSKMVSIIRNPDILAVAKDNLQGKIVVIGNSYRDSGDWHLTPVGEMPGMYIIGNAINTIVNNLQPISSPWWFTTVFNIAAVVLAACMFQFISSYLIDLGITLVLSAFLFQIAWLSYIKWGVYCNFLMPFAVMWLVQLSNRHFRNFVQYWQKKREKKEQKEV
jgi:CHASE2 domain-containing sensor protein